MGAAIGAVEDLTALSIREGVGHALSFTAGLTPASIVSIVLGLIVITTTLVVVRNYRTRKALSPAQRVHFDVLPSDSFDPSSEEIDRYAAQLARTRRAIRRGTSRSAHAIRLRLDAAGDGTVHYRIEGHRRAASILGTPGFHEVELRPLPAEVTEPTATPTSTDEGTPDASTGGQGPP